MTENESRVEFHPDSESIFANRKAKFEITLTQYTYAGEANMGWECDVRFEGRFVGGGTAPTAEDVYGMAQEIISEYEDMS